jgi:hypothetical protein
MLLPLWGCSQRAPWPHVWDGACAVSGYGKPGHMGGTVQYSQGQVIKGVVEV